MKPQEGVLVTEISKLQGIVSELKAGFSNALHELSQIQHGDTFLREELEENRRSCEKKALHLEALVQSLRDELGEMRCQILQLCCSRQIPQQEAKAPDRGPGPAAKERETDSGPGAGRSHCECFSSPPVSSPRGRVLLHCYLQGLKAGLCEATEERQQLTTQLLHSEWEYVSILNQLYDKYKTPPVLQSNLEPYQTFLKFVEQLLQRHLLFRNTLEERLSAQHWKCLVGDIFVQLIGHNDSSFTDTYHGYTSTLAAFLSLEFDRIKLSKKMHTMQSCEVEREELKLLSLLLAPVSRVHSYLSHIQSLLQWTGKEHPDSSLLQGSERVLRNILSRCHVILEEDVRWGEGGVAGLSVCSESVPACSGAQSCSARKATREQPSGAPQRQDQHHGNLSNGLSNGCHPGGWSHSLRRKSCIRDRTVQECGPPRPGPPCCLLHPGEQGWTGEMTSDSGQGTSSQAANGASRLDTPHAGRSLEDGETDEAGDTSVFDYSSVTSCSPDGTLRSGVEGSNSGEEEEEEEEEDSHVPVLLKPSSYPQQQLRDTPRERTVCLRWQIPRLSPHPPQRPCLEGSAPGLGTSYGKRMISIRQGSPPLLPNSAFRPIWDEPYKQGEASPVKENPQGFVPIQTQERQLFPNYHQAQSCRSGVEASPFQDQQGRSRLARRPGVWDESEDSEGPCSTV
ncbi:uncharacterized protein si:ch211-67f24.7 [Osmerus eperlanus]|uniref:uncharacterized protein si:ch211-67f24.7 n=1 Tax=Osmerus eperlanus TaxID=29151 RepID=UPI002E131868